MFRTARFLILATIATTPAAAQWTRLSYPDGGGLSRVTAVGNTWLAATYGRGLFRSTDAGATWTLGGAGLDPSIAMLATVGDRVYAATQTKVLYKSDDAGATWTKVYTFANVDVNAVVSAGPNLIVGTTRGLHLSTDGGTTWTPARLPGQLLMQMPVNAIVADRGVLYAGSGGGGVVVSRDNGVRWDEKKNGLANPGVIDMVATETAVFAATVGGVFRTIDGGENWMPASTGLTVPRISSIAASGTNLIAATFNGVFRSIDGGSTWTPASTGPGMAVFDLATHGTNVFAATPDGAWVSSDGGNSWTARKRGMGNEVAMTTAVSVVGTKLMVAAVDGIFMSSDDGATWSKGSGLPLNKSVRAIVPGTTSIFAGGDNGLGVYRSSDAGLTWTAASTGLPTPANVSVIAVSPRGLFAAHSKGVFKSTDDGATWTPSWVDADPAYNKPIAGMAYLGGMLFAGSMVDGIGRSMNHGGMWGATKDGLPSSGYYRDFTTVGATVLTATNKGVFASDDGGGKWVARNAGLSAAGIDTWRIVGAGRNAVVATSDGIYLSSDVGRTWRDISAGLPDRNVRQLAVRGTSLYAAGMRGWVWRYQLP